MHKNIEMQKPINKANVKIIAMNSYKTRTDISYIKTSLVDKGDLPPKKGYFFKYELTFSLL